MTASDGLAGVEQKRDVMTLHYFAQITYTRGLYEEVENLHRIHILKDRLHHAVTVEHDTDEHVGVGSIVEIADEGGEKMEVVISAVGGVSPGSPLGAALMGARVGAVVGVEAPSGSWKASVLAIRRT